MEIVTTFAVGLVGGVFGASVGGGGLLMIPYMLSLGLPPQVAIATARFGDIGLAAVASWKFRKAPEVQRAYVPLLSLLGFIGSIIGAYVLVNAIHADYLRTAAGVLLVPVLLIVLFRKKMGVVHQHVSKQKKAAGIGLYSAIQVVSGFFSAGTGPLTQYVLMGMLGFTVREGVTTQMIPFLVQTLTSLVIFAAIGLIDYQSGIAMAIGTGVGGYFGARLTLWVSDRTLKMVFAVMVMLAAIKLLLY